MREEQDNTYTRERHWGLLPQVLSPTLPGSLLPDTRHGESGMALFSTKTLLAIFEHSELSETMKGKHK